MDIERITDQQHTYDGDSTYGGSRYRLTYDRYEKKGKVSVSGRHTRPLNLILLLAVFAILFLLSVLTLLYFKHEVSQFRKTNSSSIPEAAGFQSYSDTIIDTGSDS